LHFGPVCFVTIFIDNKMTFATGQLEKTGDEQHRFGVIFYYGSIHKLLRSPMIPTRVGDH
jgi:hypothetical protein